MQFIILKEGDRVKFAESYFDSIHKEKMRGKELIVTRVKGDVIYVQQPGFKVKRPIHKDFLVPI